MGTHHGVRLHLCRGVSYIWEYICRVLMICRVDVVRRILHCTRPAAAGSPDWRRYIFLVAFMLLGVERSGWVLKEE